jgi:uncharacterized protein (DUF305 family)
MRKEESFVRKYLIGIGAAAIIALAAGCGNGDDTGGSTVSDDKASSQADDSGASAEHNEQDTMFAQMMIPHHQQAIDMAKTATKKATDSKVKDLATRIKGAQDPEILQLTDMLKKWGEMDPNMSGMDHGMNGEGMMTPQEMKHLEKLTGAEFDSMWVQMMIKHHQGAVTMAQTEVDKGSNADAKKLAQAIIDAQKSEIEEMQTMSQQ